MAEIHITSYFSADTDLAAEMRSWPEFRSGSEYSVELESAESGEAVSVSLVEREEERSYVRVAAGRPGMLFERTIGRAVYAMAAHSDNLMIHRIG